MSKYLIDFLIVNMQFKWVPIWKRHSFKLSAAFANVFNVTKKEMRKATWMRTIGKQMKPFH